MFTIDSFTINSFDSPQGHLLYTHLKHDLYWFVRLFMILNVIIYWRVMMFLMLNSQIK